MKILYLILSHQSTMDKLHACLQTWVHDISPEHKVLILGDITMVDNMHGYQVYKPLSSETYYDLPKKMYRSYVHIMNMEWDYIVKVDDDCYLNIDNLNNQLSEMSDITTLYTGQGIHFKTNKKPNYLSNCGDKLPPEQYTMYYAQGGCYIISKPALTLALDKMQYINPPFDAEDVMVGMAMTESSILLHDRPDLFDSGWCGRGWGPGTGVCRPHTIEERINFIKNKHISTHKLESHDIVKIHTSLQKNDT